MKRKGCFKRLLSMLLLTIIMLVAVVPITASAATDSTEKHSVSQLSAYSSTNPDDYPAPTRNLYYNGGATAMTGNDVKWLQSVLVHLGYTLEVDGSYGPITRDTIKKFQSKNGLTVDGKTGPKTRPKLKEVWQKTGHSWDSGTVTTQPTETNTGVKTYKCAYCDAQKQEAIPSIQSPSAPAQKTYTIAGVEFNKNLDYYISEVDSSDYDPTLSNMLAALSLTAYDKKEIKKAYQELGFTENFGTSFYNTENPAHCAFAIGIKNSEYNNDKICLISLRGSTPTSDWIANFTILTLLEEKHAGFLAPALFAYEQIKSILDNDITADNVKFVITGHSRGGAVGNLLAVELMEQGVHPDNVYNYNYAPPDVACKEDFPYYGNIFNLCNRADLVPKLPGVICSALTTPGTFWGKFGKTHRFTNSKGRFSFVENHKMETYLEFFNLRLDIEEWPRSSDDEERDAAMNFLGILTKIFCPVDAVVTDKDGNPIASVIGGEVTYYTDNFGEVIIFVQDDHKIIYMDSESEYNINLVGTDTGTMLYSLEKCDLSTGEISEAKTFENVALEKGKTMFSPISEVDSLSDAELFIVEEDEDGKIVYTHTIATDGKEEIYVENSQFNLSETLKDHAAELIIIGAVSIVGIMAIAILTSGKKKKKKRILSEEEAIKEKFLNV